MRQFIRNFKKQKTVGLLNICSLSLGVMVSTIIGLWAINELSFDNFHKKRDNIYHVILHATVNDSPIKSAMTFKPLGEEAIDKLPQIEEMLRITIDSEELRINSIYQSEVDVIACDNNFFTFFTFPLKEGDPESVLSAPDKAVISERAAIRYFSEEEAIGQIININGHDFTVSGIMKNMPLNSSLQSDFILPFYGHHLTQSWRDNDGYITFFNLPKEVDIQFIENTMTELSHIGMPLFKTLNTNYTLEPLSEMHFDEDFMGYDHLVRGNRSLIMVLALVAVIILIISCINFTNLFISTSFIRARSIGIMKSQGAGRTSLIRAFYVETACYTAIAIIIGVILAIFTLPIFDNFIGSNMEIDFASVNLYLFLSNLFLFTILLAGTFPALYITRFNPVETLTGKFRGKQLSIFQKSLIIIQFSASIALLIVVSFMQKQVDFIISKDLGFDKENVLYVNGRINFGLEKYEMLKEEFLKHPVITNVTAKNSPPTEWRQGWGIGKIGTEENTMMEMNYVKPDYFDFMDMQIIDGENPFYLESQDSIISVVLNESAVKLLNLDSPVNQLIIANNWNRMVVKGVMKNANIRSLRDEIDPQVYMKLDRGWWPVYFFKYIGDPQQAIDVIKQKWDELEPDTPFQYYFLDETYRELYKSEQNVSLILSFAMLITLVISIAGLFAMAFYATQRRTKEIALRKVNGATIKDLLLLLNRDFVIWIAISFVIAAPLAYFSLQSWLNGFTVKTSLSIWIFLLVGIVALTITLLTTSFQTWQTANTNPVESLKSE
jgi:ABC-type transport system, involved in lipoprotein release, permease component